MGLVIVTSLLEYGMILICLREICLSSAARILGRPETR